MPTPSSQKVAILTGGSTGMGKSIAARLVENNWKLAIFDINKAGIELATKLGDNADFYEVNVASYTSQADAFKAVFKKWGRIDAVLAHAGIVDRSSIYILRERSNSVDDIPPAPNTLTTDVDWKGVVYSTQLAIHFMRHNPGGPGGKIIATSSASAVIPQPTFPEYLGAKAAVVNFVRGTAPILQLKENIAISCICPGLVNTNIIPKEMIEAIGEDVLTPVGTIVDAFEKILNEQGFSYAGVVFEASAKSVLPIEMPKLANGSISGRTMTVWEPLFNGLHGENTGLPNTVF